MVGFEHLKPHSVIGHHTLRVIKIMSRSELTNKKDDCND